MARDPVIVQVGAYAGRLNLVSGLTVVVDETRLVKDPALVAAVPYVIPKNHGRLQARPAVDGGTGKLRARHQ